MPSRMRLPWPLKQSSSRGLLTSVSRTQRSWIIDSRSSQRRGILSKTTIADPSNKVQVYISRSNDPFINLSIEDHLLTSSHPESRILFLYTNRPSVVIGRNQNPWIEVNLPLLAQIRDHPDTVSNWNSGPIDLVRRRSGGGAVFHDQGNVNFSVIVPPAEFDREKHAWMVVRALKNIGREHLHVNVRHDIVVNLRPEDESTEYVRKVSGSAYKLTRQRALHHGTCLLQSPNLKLISPILRSPAAPFIKALGSASVRSPIANVDVEPNTFMQAVVTEFGRMYGKFDVHLEEVDISEEGGGQPNFLPLEEIRSKVDELRSKEWMYGQTPRFSFRNTEPTVPVTEAALRTMDNQIFFEARQGKIEKFEVNGVELPINEEASRSELCKNLWECGEWNDKLAGAGLSESDARVAGSWLHDILGTSFTKSAQ